MQSESVTFERYWLAFAFIGYPLSRKRNVDVRVIVLILTRYQNRRCRAVSFSYYPEFLSPAGVIGRENPQSLIHRKIVLLFIFVA
jgi:hypothetical protein